MSCNGTNGNNTLGNPPQQIGWKSILKGNVLYLGLTSLFTDMSSEMVYPLLPLFIAGLVPAGSAVIYIGLMEGIAESTASLLKLVSGYISDKLSRRKTLTVAGYLISTICRFFMAFSQTGLQVVLFRFLDRIGKGIRTSPRDALLSESTPIEHRGLAFSFHRAMDHLGAVTGPILSVIILYLVLNEKFLPFMETAPERANLFSLRMLFFLSVIPGLIAVLVLAFFLKEVLPAKKESITHAINSEKKAPSLPKIFYLYLASVSVFALGNSSDLFLVFYGSEKFHYGPLGVIIAWVLLHISKVCFSFPGGRLSDKFGRFRVILAGWTIYTFVYLAMGFIQTSLLFWLLLLIYGAYYGFTEGVEKA
ncbi:MAG: MFS transporter, partial [Candidatus Hydrogenedens sp.]